MNGLLGMTLFMGIGICIGVFIHYLIFRSLGMEFSWK